MSIKEEFLHVLERKGITRSEACTRMSISNASLSLYLNDKYGADVSNIESAINNFIETEEEKDRLQKVSKKFVGIPKAQESVEVIRKVHIDPDIFMLTAEPGYGKTTILDEYAARYASAIKVDAVAPSAYALLRELCEALDISSTGSAHDMTRRCIKKLKGTESLIMVDEAEFLSSEALNTLRRIHDLADVGLVIAGTKRLAVTVAAEAQLASRIVKRIQLDVLNDEEFSESLDMVLASLLPVVNGVNYMDVPRVVEAFHHHAGREGYRYLFKLVKSVVGCMNLNENGITPKLIKACAKGLVRKDGLVRA